MKQASSPQPAGAAGSPSDSLFDVTTVRHALTLAIRAPSIHNTQPWRWDLKSGVLRLRADRSRQLAVADPDGHSLMISCGAALALAELGLRAEGWKVAASRMPDPADPDLLAELRALGSCEPTPDDLDRRTAAQHRRSERRPFAAGRLSDSDIDGLRDAAASPGVFAHFPIRPEQNLELAVAVSHADRFQRNDADYLAEMARWIRADDGSPDGVPTTVVPHVPGADPRHTDVPLRDFEVGIPGSQLIDPGIDEKPSLAVVFTDEDKAINRLQAGEAMMRLMIHAEVAGLSSCPLSQAVDMLAFRVRLQTLMGWAQYPQMMLRLGLRPSGAGAPPTRRRPLSDVFADR